MKKNILIRHFYEGLLKKKLNVNYLGDEAWLLHKLHSSYVEYPGLALAGVWDYFPESTLVFLTKRDLLFFSTLSEKKKNATLANFLKYNVSGFIIRECKKQEPILFSFCEANQIPIFTVNATMQQINYTLAEVLEELFAEETTIHGVLVDVAEQGVLIIGKAGIGKSECALELVRREHRLVADDIVKITKKKNALWGKAPYPDMPYLEIRGVGIIDIKDFYGLRAVTDEKRIDLVVKLVMFDKKKHFERLGLDRETYSILGIELPMYIIPVSPGKNISTVVEVIAKNEYAKEKGFNTPMKISSILMEKIKNRKYEKQ